MNSLNKLRTSLATCTLLVLYAASFIASAQEASSGAYGDITFFNSRNEKICSLPVPETSQFFDFSSSSQHCENNSAATFQLENIPSATLIQFYENERCSDSKLNDNFFVKLQTVKQPTDWTNPLSQMNFNDFKNKKTGDLIPKKNIRVNDKWEGSEYSEVSWDERISCVYIVRSQPVN